MAVWTMMQGLGYVTWVTIDRRYNYIKLIVIGSIFICTNIYDYFFFRMHPAQENIFVEDSRRNRLGKQDFDIMASTVKMKAEEQSDSKRESVFDLNRYSQPGVSFMMAFKDKKIYQLVIACGIRMTASSLGVQDSALFRSLNFHTKHHHETPVGLIKQEQFFYMGVATGGFFCVFLYVTIFQRKQYLMFVALNSYYALLTCAFYLVIVLYERYNEGYSGHVIKFLHS